MEHTPLTLLNLCTPLRYVRTESRSAPAAEGETILCYEVNPIQGSSIEPDRERFLGKLLFIGEKAAETPSGEAEKTKEFVSLPQGDYLFMQCRSDAVLTSDEWLDLAIEQQKDGLWERNKPGALLYVRFLFEDGAFVTQVFRTV